MRLLRGFWSRLELFGELFERFVALGIRLGASPWGCFWVMFPRVGSCPVVSGRVGSCPVWVGGCGVGRRGDYGG